MRSRSGCVLSLHVMTTIAASCSHISRWFKCGFPSTVKQLVAKRSCLRQVVRRPHFLLVTLVLCNAACTEVLVLCFCSPAFEHRDSMFSTVLLRFPALSRAVVAMPRCFCVSLLCGCPAADTPNLSGPLGRPRDSHLALDHRCAHFRCAACPTCVCFWHKLFLAAWLACLAFTTGISEPCRGVLYSPAGNGIASTSVCLYVPQ